MKSMGRSFVALVVVGLVSGTVLGLTNPTRQAHLDTIQLTIKEESGVIGRLVFRVSQAVEGKRFEYHNYLLFSTVTLDGEVISLGLLKNVVVMNNTQISQFAQEDD